MMMVTEGEHYMHEDMKDSSEDRTDEIDPIDTKNDEVMGVNECVKKTEKGDEVEARVNKDDLDEERMESKGVKRFNRDDEEVGL